MQPPWHMWGNHLDISLVASGAPFDINSQQLINVNYARPETWSWLFWCQVVDSPSAGAPGVVQARFNLTTGIGRARVTIPDFVMFIYTPILPNANLRYTTSVTDTESQVLADIPSQDIILNVSAIITGGAAPGSRVDLVVGAMFAPKSHIRPEWYEGRFPGGEDAGK